MGDEPDYRRDNDDYFSNDNYDDGMQGSGGPGQFRGRGGGAPWRGRGGRGNFNEFGGNRGGGGGPRFGRGRGGFMGGPRGGPGGQRGGSGPGFMNRGRFRGPGPGGNDFGGNNGNNWSEGPPPDFQHGGMQGNQNQGGFSNTNTPNSGEAVWAEARSPDGKIYYYHTVTRETTWDRPDGPGVRIVRHDEWGKSSQEPGFGPKGDGPSDSNMAFSHGPGPRPGFGSNESPGGTFMGPPGPGTEASKARPDLSSSSEGGFSSVGPDGANVDSKSMSAVSEEKAGQKTEGISNVSANGGQNQAMPMPMPMIPPFAPFGAAGHPPFQMPPPNFAPRGFAPMVPPPWGIPPGMPPPAGVPPPMAIDQIVMAQIDPKIVASAFDWTEHISPNGKPYYFCAKTQASVWEKPAALIEFEAAKLAVQQRLSATPSAMPSLLSGKDKSFSDKSDFSDAKLKESKKEKKPSAQEKCRPISSTPVSGTPWCVVWTGDKRVFFYNPSNKTSVWEKPPELVGRYDVEELLRAPPDPSKSQSKVKKVEATSTTSPQTENDKEIKIDSKGKSSENDENSEKEPPVKRSKRDSEAMESDDNDEDVVILEEESKISSKKDKVKIETKDGLKEINALEAEAKAARERAVVPLETRLQKFREMLVEKQVSAFSTWEKELHKIVFDPRYLYLTSKERKQAFESYVKERAEEERKEKKKMFKQVKEHFLAFLEDVGISPRTTYNEFTQRFGRDERYRIVEKTREREQYFSEYIQELKKKEKEDRASKKVKARDDFIDLLRDKIKDYHTKWSEARKRVEKDARYQAVETDERETLYRTFQKKLKSETRKKEKKRKKAKKSKRSRSGRGDEKSENPLGLDVIDSNEEDIEDEEDKNEPGQIKEDDESENQNEEISEEEEEEGCVSEDSDDDKRLQRERKQRAELSLREREKEVQRTLEGYNRDRDKEREHYQHEEAIQEYQALLTDLVRIADTNWKDAKRLFKKDQRWESVSAALSREEIEEHFKQHCENVGRKKSQKFRELLDEANVKLSSQWREIRKRIKDDPRYSKFSNSDRKCEREFDAYIKDLSSAMKADFRNLLKETKMLTYKTKQQLRESSHLMRDIESVLEKDKRFLQLEEMREERRRLLLEYLDDLERKGPPPPPTASEPSRRLKI